MLRRRVHRKDYDFRGRTRFTYLMGCLNTVQLGHGNVHNNYVGFQSQYFSHRISSGARFACNCDIGLRLKEQSKALSDHSVIIGQKDPNIRANHCNMFAS